MSNAIAFAPVANAVVQNDITITTPLAITQPLTQMLADLETQRVVWEEGAYRTSNQALYALLAHCLALAQTNTPEEAKQRNAALAAFYQSRGYAPAKSSTPPATRIVKAVFGGVDRRRLSTYSLVLREAQRQLVLPTELAGWIERMGGVQEIRVSQSASFISPKQKAQIALDAVEQSPELAVIKTEALSLLADAERMGEDCVLLARQQADGSFVVRAVLRTAGLVSAAYTALYAQQKAAQCDAALQRQAANDADGAVVAVGQAA
jgi:hypothetical protein